jgi:serine/threonine protein kinase
MAGEGISKGALLGDRYRLDRRLGAGGMASVWLARDERLDREVAVKILSDVLASDPDYRTRFEREARVAAGLSHPNLVEVFDFSSESDRPYLVMRYVPGPTLADRIGQRGRGVDGERLARELLDALAYIHDAGVIHRDLKPSNVLFGARGEAQLTDFGIAQRADATALTKTGQVVGTIAYMAPEVRAGKQATERSDLYSLGVLLGEAAGRSDPRIERLIGSLTERDPARRPRGASKALAQLSGGGETTTAVLPTRRPRLDRRVLLAAMATGAALVGVLAILNSGGGGDSASSKGEAKRPQPAISTVTHPTPPSAAEAAPPAPPAQASSATDSCVQLEAQRQALEDQKHASDEQFKHDPEAKKQAHDALEEQKHALDEQLKACH